MRPRQQVPARRRARWLAAGAAGLTAIASAGCGTSPKTISALPSAPSASTLSATSVSHGRFVSTVTTDDGKLTIAPPPHGARAALARATAYAMFEAADAAEGSYAASVFGLASVSIQARAKTTSTTAAVPSTTAAGAATSAPTSSSSPVETPTTTTTPLPAYRSRVAWVGIAWGGIGECGAARSSTKLGAASSSVVAVLIDAHSGHDVVAYTDYSTKSCAAGPVGPRFVRPSEFLSVPWQPVGPASTAVNVTIPLCGQYVGWTELAAATGASGPSIEVVATAPFDPDCGASAPDVMAVDSVVPLGSAQQQVPHAPVRPIDELKVLP